MNLDRPSAGQAITDTDRGIPVPDDAICFGPFVLIPQHHVLLKNGEPVALGSRAMLLLIALASRAGELLDKAELLSLAWPKVVVEECNLRAQILTLRRALGDNPDFGCIATVPGRGYRFIAPINPVPVPPPLPAPQSSLQPRPPSPRIFGQDALLRSLDAQLADCRFVTLTGHAGTGKTTVALALANRILPQFAQGVRFIDLTPVSRGPLVHVAIAEALGIDHSLGEPLQLIGQRLAGSQVLLILDTCEHVLEDAATAIERILHQAPLCAVLVTSREPLRADGEFVHDLAPLPFPPENIQLATAQALTYPAVQLLVERMAAHDLDYLFSDQDVPAAAAICRKLDGNPLAIEIAAARVRAFGIEPLVDMLDGSFRLHMTGRRTALPRHRTLSAALDWTYAMLSPVEQAMFRQLSVFTGLFTLAAVDAVIDVDAQDRAHRVEQLMDKSLVMAREQGAAQRYRLLETTRLYAAHKLSEAEETDATAQRHARWTLEELKTSVQDLVHTTPPAWLARYGADVDSVHAALDWAYSPSGDLALAVELTLVSVPLWLRLSLTDECHDWVSRGLQSTAQRTPVRQHQRMFLLTASASVRVLAYGGGARIRAAWLHVLEHARALNDTEHQLRALWGLWNDRSCQNQYVAALDLAEQYLALSQRGHHSDRQLLGLRMRANALFHMGRLADARTSVIEALSSPLSANTHLIDLHFDQRIAAQSLKAQIQLLQGEVGPALLALENNVGQAITLNHPATLWYTLCLSAIPTTLLMGHLQQARDYLAVLNDSLVGHELYVWRQFARCFDDILLIRQGAAEDGVPRLGEGLAQLRQQGDSPLHSLFRSEYAQGLALLGLEDRALQVIDQTLHTARGREERWFVPELLRIKARILLGRETPPLAQARRLLQEARHEARDQGAHFWTARIAADLERLQQVESGALLPQA